MSRAFNGPARLKKYDHCVAGGFIRVQVCHPSCSNPGLRDAETLREDH